MDKTNPKDVFNYLKFLCGESIANELMKLDDPISILENRDTETLLKVKGIGKMKPKAIYENLN